MKSSIQNISEALGGSTQPQQPAAAQAGSSRQPRQLFIPEELTTPSRPDGTTMVSPTDDLTYEYENWDDAFWDPRNFLFDFSDNAVDPTHMTDLLPKGFGFLESLPFGGMQDNVSPEIPTFGQAGASQDPLTSISSERMDFAGPSNSASNMSFSNPRATAEEAAITAQVDSSQQGIERASPGEGSVRTSKGKGKTRGQDKGKGKALAGTDEGNPAPLSLISFDDQNLHDKLAKTRELAQIMPLWVNRLHDLYGELDQATIGAIEADQSHTINALGRVWLISLLNIVSDKLSASGNRFWRETDNSKDSVISMKNTLLICKVANTLNAHVSGMKPHISDWKTAEKLWEAVNAQITAYYPHNEVKLFQSLFKAAKSYSNRDEYGAPESAQSQSRMTATSTSHSSLPTQRSQPTSHRDSASKRQLTPIDSTGGANATHKRSRIGDSPGNRPPSEQSNSEQAWYAEWMGLGADLQQRDIYAEPSVSFWGEETLSIEQARGIPFSLDTGPEIMGNTSFSARTVLTTAAGMAGLTLTHDGKEVIDLTKD
ncbi:hypothetical protein NliqN6_1658 [Naganishia liquefaciens]|uniref:Uncharacterized protein n=1 Tax=Naganishia liquefaciens TaxID=104408 RepID=A0A8H3YF15_9TREE|nr:hypothetical protein NliqN6_1658 [Naganishia liquefaciens]